MDFLFAHQEFLNHKPNHGFSFQSVDQLKDVRVDLASPAHRTAFYLIRPDERFSFQFLLEDDEDADTSECEQCVQLVKAMLTMDGAERISPKEILSHSFITRTPRQESPIKASRGDDSQTEWPSSVALCWEDAKTLKQSDDGDVKAH